jgi:hypothetical protein
VLVENRCEGMRSNKTLQKKGPEAYHPSYVGSM